MHQYVYWTHLEDKKFNFYLAATEEGLCFVGSLNQSIGELMEWTQKRLPNHQLIKGDEKLQPYVCELREYLNGERQTFNFKTDLYGTSFQLVVWDKLKQIPYGKTYSYSDIAIMVEKPKAARAVGTAIGANPILITVPCHRVMGKNGALTGYRGGLDMKRLLLTIENSECQYFS